MTSTETDGAHSLPSWQANFTPPMERIYNSHPIKVKDKSSNKKNSIINFYFNQYIMFTPRTDYKLRHQVHKNK